MVGSNLQYKKEHDGLVETRVEQKITIQSDGDPIDHDRALAEAIQVRAVLATCFFILKTMFNCLQSTEKHEWACRNEFSL